jgi:hypothetical protein
MIYPISWRREYCKDLTHGTVGREFVIAKNPDYIFIATMGIVGEEEKKIWSKYPNLNAARNNRIFIVIPTWHVNLPRSLLCKRWKFCSKRSWAITSNPLQNGQKDIIMEHACVTAVGSGIFCLPAIAERW